LDENFQCIKLKVEPYLADLAHHLPRGWSWCYY